MLAIGLTLVRFVGFGRATIFARYGMRGIKPLHGKLISGVATFCLIALLAMMLTYRISKCCRSTI